MHNPRDQARATKTQLSESGHYHDALIDVVALCDNTRHLRVDDLAASIKHIYNRRLPSLEFDEKTTEGRLRSRYSTRRRGKPHFRSLNRVPCAFDNLAHRDPRVINFEMALVLEVDSLRNPGQVAATIEKLNGQLHAHRCSVRLCVVRRQSTCPVRVGIQR